MSLAWRGVTAVRALGLVLCIALFDGACSSDEDEAGDGGDQVSQEGGVSGNCRYAGQTYLVGDTFASEDGCNTCICESDGRVACTLRACAPPDGGGFDTCNDINPGMICVRGTSGQTGEVLSAGDPLEVTVYPLGCWSSSCTDPDVSECSVTGSDPFVVDARFCLATTGSSSAGCTTDCGGGGFADCASGTTLVAGEHTVTLGSLSVTVTVPSTLPFGGECDGSPL